jgi:hypothetical protein
MSVDSIFSAVDAAISGEAADTSKKKKEAKQSAGGKESGPGFFSELTSTILGNNKNAPGAEGQIPTGPTAAEMQGSTKAKTTGFADGVDGQQAPQSTAPEVAASAPQGAAVKSGEDTIKLLFKLFGM